MSCQWHHSQDSHCYGEDAQGAELKMYVNLILEISTSFVNDLHIHTFLGFVTAAAATAAPAVFT